MLNLSSNEIDKILSFVKYVLVQDINEETKKKVREKIRETTSRE